MRAPVAALVLALAALPASATGEERPRLLLIALDAVPYDVVAKLADPERGEAALFAGLAGPVPVVSTFPSTTSLALTGLLAPFGLDPAPGYEPRFFDRVANRRRGGGPLDYRRIRFSWKERFDWRLRALAPKLLQGAAPLRASRREIDRALAAFAASDRDLFSIYVGATDLAAHLRGPDRLADPLLHLDRALQRLRVGPGRPFHTVLVSDHGLAGGAPLRNARRGVVRGLRAAGFRATGRIRGPRDVVLVPFGLVSSLVAFTAPGVEAELAGTLAAVPGIELCATSDGAGWRVVAVAGSARFERRERMEVAGWCYRVAGEDPLRLAAAARAHGEPDDACPGGTWRSDDDWRRASLATDHPDPLHRVARGFDLVENPASVICSTAPSWMFGGRAADLASRLTVGPLRWTHGALHGAASLGFLMTDLPGWRAEGYPARGALRFDEALAPFAWPERR